MPEDKLTLRQGTWAAVVEADPFQELLISATSVSITYALLRTQDVPDWLLFHPVLILLGFLLAFQRIRLARQVENATAAVWDKVTPFYTAAQSSVNEILDWPYLATLFILPFTAFAPMLLLGVFVVLSVVSLSYERMFLPTLKRYYSFHRYSDADRRTCEVDRFFRRRSYLVTADTLVGLSAFLAIGLAVESPGIARGIAGAAFVVLMVNNGVLPYIVNRAAYTVGGLDEIVRAQTA